MRAARAALAALLLAPGASALDLGGGAGTGGADFLTIGVGARPLGMGGAFSAVDMGLDANAANWNPAGLARVDAPAVTTSYSSLFEDQRQGYVGYAGPLAGAGGTWGAGVNYLTVSNIEKRAGDTEAPDSTFSNQNYAAALSYARALGGGVALGGNLKYVRTALDSAKHSAMAFDLGALAGTPVEGLTVGGFVRHLGSNIGPDPLPLTFQGGAAYRALASRLLLAADLQMLATERRGAAGLGAELWISPNLAARAGWRQQSASDRLNSGLVGFSTGLGFKFSRFAADYAFLPYGDLGNTHRVTLGLRFR